MLKPEQQEVVTSAENKYENKPQTNPLNKEKTKILQVM